MAFKQRESLDTNAILRLMLWDIPEQAEVVFALLHRPGVEYNVADLAITEAVYVLQKLNKTREEIIMMLDSLFKPLNVNANFGLFEQVFPIYLRYPKLSFNDCCLAVYAELNEAEPLWTFDQKLTKQLPGAKMLA